MDSSSTTTSSSTGSSSSSSNMLCMPTNNDFSQDIAKRLLKHCATLIVQNFPIGSEFGIDLLIHYTGEKFLGIKMIPPGIHYVHFSVVVNRNDRSAVSPRTGFFHYFKQADFLVSLWNERDEDVVLLSQENGDSATIEQIQRFKMAYDRGTLDNQLGAYQFDRYQTWVSLTDYITCSLFNHLHPKCGKIFSASSLVYKPNEDGTTTIGKLDAQGLPEMVIAPECAINFITKPPKRFLYPPNSTPKEITTYSLDSTFTLETLLSQLDHKLNNHIDDDDDDHGSTSTTSTESALLGELQFAFIAFLLGHVYEAFEHWTALLRIICSARDALTTKPDLFLAFIRVIYFQLKQTNEEIFADIVENENQVYNLLRTFVLNIRNCTVNDDDNGNDQTSTSTTTTTPITSINKNKVIELKRRGEKFSQSLQKTLQWNFDDEPDDELPTIVQLDDD